MQYVSAAAHSSLTLRRPGWYAMLSMYYPSDCHHCTPLLKGNFQGQKSRLKLFSLIQKLLHNMAEDIPLYFHHLPPNIKKTKKRLPKNFSRTILNFDSVNASTLVVISVLVFKMFQLGENG